MATHDEIFDIIPEHYTVEHIIRNFDFYKVERYMREHNWTWVSTRGMSSPNVKELKDCAERLLKDARASELDHISLGTGGFTALKLYNTLYLYFAIEESSDEYDDNKYYD